MCVCVFWFRGAPDGGAAFVCVRQRELSVSFYEESGLFDD